MGARPRVPAPLGLLPPGARPRAGRLQRALCGARPRAVSLHWLGGTGGAGHEGAIPLHWLGGPGRAGHAEAVSLHWLAGLRGVGR